MGELDGIYTLLWYLYTSIVCVHFYGICTLLYAIYTLLWRGERDLKMGENRGKGEKIDVRLENGRVENRPFCFPTMVEKW